MAVAVGVLAVTGAGATLVLDHGRVWVTPDSVAYLGAAGNIAHGHGITTPFRTTLDEFSATPSAAVPLTHWPSGYPLLLAALSALGATATASALIWNAIFAAALVGAAAAVAWRVTGRARWAALAAALVLSMGAVFQNGRFALSDFVFTSIAAAAAYLWAAAIDGAALAPAGLILVTCAATSVKWLGLILCLPATLACWLGPPRRFGRGAMVAQLAVPAIWFVVMVLTGGGAPRSVGLHPVLGLATVVRSAGSWFLPAQAPSGVQVGVGVAAAVMGATLFASVVASRASPFRLVLLTAITAYIGAMLATRAFLDVTVPWDNRLLAPVLLLTGLLVLELASEGQRRQRLAGLTALVLLAVGQLSLWPRMLSESDRPIGYTGTRWTAMPMKELAARLQPFSVIASNRPDVVYFWLHRTALAVPQQSDPETLERNSQMVPQLAALRRSLSSAGALVLFDDPSNPRRYLVSERTAVQALGLRPMASFKGARIYASLGAARKDVLR